MATNLNQRQSKAGEAIFWGLEDALGLSLVCKPHANHVLLPTWATQKSIHGLELGIPFRQQTLVLDGSKVGYILQREKSRKLY